MKRKVANHELQQGLFDLDEPSVVLAQVKTAQLVMLVETLLIEIAVAGFPDCARADRRSTGGYRRKPCARGAQR